MKKVRFAFAATAVALLAGYSFAGPGDQILRLVTGKNGTGLAFGRSVSIRGTRVLIGDPSSDDPLGNRRTGVAYLFDTTTGQITTILNPKPPSGSGFRFGEAVAIWGNKAVCGSPGFATAEVFRVPSGKRLLVLRGQDDLPGSGFGSALDMDGSYIVVGAPLHLHNGVRSGAAFVFDAGTGLQVAELLPGDPYTDGSLFGASVAIDGGKVVVGAPEYASGPSSVDTGAAYLFDASTGVQLRRIVSNGPQDHSKFGTSVDLFGAYVAIGAPGLTSYPGAAQAQVAGGSFVFDVGSGALRMGITGQSTAGFSGRFGASVRLDQGTLLVGAPAQVIAAGSSRGAAYLYDVRTGLLFATLAPSPAGFGYRSFGGAVAIEGGRCVVTDSFDKVGATPAGWGGSSAFDQAAYVFDSTNPSVAPSVTIRSGSGVNALRLVARSEPALGSIWTVDVDASGHVPSLVTLEILSQPSSGMFLPSGELLVDLTSARIGHVLGLHSGQSASLSVLVPLDGSLFGARVYAQAGIFGAPGLELTNGLELVLGL